MTFIEFQNFRAESWTQSVDAGRNIAGGLFAESCCARSMEVRVVVRWNLVARVLCQ